MPRGASPAADPAAAVEGPGVTGASRCRAHGPGTPAPGVLFVLGLAVALSAGRAAAASAPGCGLDRVDARVRVTYVYDGDTVRLADGARLRLIGIDTPELHPDGGPPQPLAVAARTRLRTLLERHGYRLQLRFDRERRDRYGRLLAHAFLDNGQSLEGRLLAAGLGTALVVPPNLWHVGCYAAAEAGARRAGRGVWALPAYRPVAAGRLPAHARGFHLVTGRVVRVRRTRRSVWLDLDGRLAVRIARADLIYFVGHDLEALTGREVLVRGWIHGYRGGRFLRVRYPTALVPSP